MKSLVPAITPPIGAPSPFEKSIQAESQPDPLLAELVFARRVMQGVVAGEERLEQVVPVVRRNPDAGIRDLHAHPIRPIGAILETS